MSTPSAVLIGATLVLAIFLLWQTRISAMITLYTGQAALLGLNALWLGVTRRQSEFLLVGLLALAGRAWLGVRLLRQAARSRPADSALPKVWPAMLLLAGFLALPEPGEAPAITAALLLPGLVLLATRREALARSIGFLSVENAAFLAVLLLAPPRLLLPLTLTGLATAGALLALERDPTAWLRGGPR